MNNPLVIQGVVHEAPLFLLTINQQMHKEWPYYNTSKISTIKLSRNSRLVQISQNSFFTKIISTIHSPNIMISHMNSYLYLLFNRILKKLNFAQNLLLKNLSQLGSQFSSTRLSLFFIIIVMCSRFCFLHLIPRYLVI